MEKFRREIRGIVLSTIIGLLSYFGADVLPYSLGSILLALLIGMLIGNSLAIPHSFQSGISFTSSKLLEFSILFLAFSINYTHITSLGFESFSIVAIVVVVMLLLSYYLALKFNCPGATGWLVGFGTTICGSSAIAALAPSIAKNKDDVAISMAVVNLFGSIGMIVMPIILLKFDLSPKQMGLMLGVGLHSIGNVAGAGYSIGNDVGVAAVTFKLARVALLSPALIFFNYLVNKNSKKNLKEIFALPWYLWSFIGITIVSSLVDFGPQFLAIMETLGKIILTIAMAAIGLKVSFKHLFQSGRKGLVFGLLMFAVQVALVAGLMYFI